MPGEPLISETPGYTARFVLNDHRRPRPHHDLRLETGGTLRCWAVPRGLPDDPARNRLAVAVPDHGLEHLTYTDADKSIEDHGTWELEDADAKRLVIVLHGQAGPRRYALIRTDSDWLIHLTRDQPADAPANTGRARP